MNRIYSIIFILITSTLPTFAFAETIYLKNGNRLEADIVKTTTDSVIIQLEEGFMAIHKSEILTGDQVYEKVEKLKAKPRKPIKKTKAPTELTQNIFVPSSKIKNLTILKDILNKHVVQHQSAIIHFFDDFSNATTKSHEDKKHWKAEYRYDSHTRLEEFYFIRIPDPVNNPNEVIKIGAPMSLFTNTEIDLRKSKTGI